MKVIDHTDSKWLSLFRRVNGSLTYSQDLVKYQIPNWAEILDDDCIVSTCPRFNDVDVSGNYKIAIQYLHSYPYISPVSRVTQVLWNKKFKAEKVVFITAYKAFEKELKASGLNAVYIPMAIDVQAIEKYKAIEPPEPKQKIIYFGNLIQNKLPYHGKLKRHCQLAGWEFDTISSCKFNNGSLLNREEILQKLSEYTYGIGVGRCAQEMYALGLKVMIAGTKFGGIILNNSHYNQQLATNMNARIWTFSEDIDTCLQNIHRSIVKTTDIRTMNHAEIVKEQYLI